MINANGLLISLGWLILFVFHFIHLWWNTEVSLGIRSCLRVTYSSILLVLVSNTLFASTKIYLCPLYGFLFSILIFLFLFLGGWSFSFLFITPVTSCEPVLWPFAPASSESQSCQYQCLATFKVVSESKDKKWLLVWLCAFGQHFLCYRHKDLRLLGVKDFHYHLLTRQP